MTEHLSRTFECDVTGEEIRPDDYADMLVLETVGPSSPFYHGEDHNRTLHIDGEEHPLGHERLDHDFRAYVADSDRVALIEEEMVHSRTTYHDRQTDDKEIISLFDVLQGVVDSWEVEV